MRPGSIPFYLKLDNYESFADRFAVWINLEDKKKRNKTFLSFKQSQVTWLAAVAFYVTKTFLNECVSSQRTFEKKTNRGVLR